MHSSAQKQHVIIALLTVLIAILLLLCILVFRDYHKLQQTTGIRTPAQIWRARMLSRGPLTAQDAGIIRSWMTFDYLNRVFHLSPDYLKSALNISDTRYPRLSLNTYAKGIGVSASSTISTVQSAIRNYSTSPTQ